MTARSLTEDLGEVGIRLAPGGHGVCQALGGTMQLTAEEEAMLTGDQGAGVRKAMEIVVALGQIYGAKDLVPVASVQVSGVSYKNLGDAGVEFLEEWAAQGARARVPATLNPAGMDLTNWQELGIPEEFARRQEAVLTAYGRLGILPTCTCTPYLIGHAPLLRAVPGLGRIVCGQLCQFGSGCTE
jgi:predicted aconitase